MRVLVCAKAVPEGLRRVALDGKDGIVQGEYHRLGMNESDEYALEEALRLKRQHAAEVAVLSLGDLRCQDILYRSLAKGADAATRIDADVGDPQLSADIIAAAARTMAGDLILTGVESADTMAAQVGIAVAERLGLPFVFAVTRVEIQPTGSAVRVVKELGGGRRQALEIDLPALLCVQSGIQTLTYASLRKVMRARQQPISCLRLADLGFNAAELESRRLKIVKVFEPPRAEQAEIISGSPGEVAGVLIERIRDVAG